MLQKSFLMYPGADWWREGAEGAVFEGTPSATLEGHAVVALLALSGCLLPRTPVHEKPAWLVLLCYFTTHLGPFIFSFFSGVGEWVVD